MDRLRAALPLARLLLGLAEHRQCGTVRIRAGARHAELTVREGVATSLLGVDSELLGDTLLREGLLDRARHDRALLGPPPEGRVGRWLVARGVASSEAVSRALLRQLEERVAVLLTWREPEVSFQARAATDGELRVALHAPVWEGLMRLARTLPTAQIDQLAGATRMELTRTGARLVATLRAHDPALPVDDVLRADPPPSLRCTRAVFRVLGAITEPCAGSDAYALLLRKRREIQRRAPAWALLDLTGPAGTTDARRAFRKLAARLHPDRFAGAPAELRALSTEVMCALAQAELTLRIARAV